MTGGGNDGVQGLKAIREKGGTVFVQSPSSCENSILPEAVLQTGITTKGYSIKELAYKIVTCATEINE